VNSLNDQQLLRQYAERRSETAFAELVRRHVDLIYSAALRMVCDSHLAQDVTQSVFIALAKNAGQLTDRPVLSGWLHRTAQNIASQTVRTDVRRRVREQEAAVMNELLATAPDHDWKQIAPQLDDALSELSEPDRDALLLRYFEKKSAHEMAQRFGISDEAAQKRVNRAVERLRESFSKRGLTIGAGGLVVVISANAVQAAPIGSAVTITMAAAALAGTVTAATVAAQTTVSWVSIKSVVAIVAAALAAGTGVYLIHQREANRFRVENQYLVGAQEKLKSERDSALSAATGKNAELERLQMDNSDLLRLRNEVGILRGQSNEIETLRKENAQLQERARSKTAGTPETNRPNVIAKIIVTRVKQPQLVTKEQILTNILSWAGEVFDREGLDLDVRRLYASGLFSQVRVNTTKTDEGVVLDYVVQERPKLAQIHFAGDTNSNSAALIPHLASTVGEKLDEQALFRDAETLQKLYEESGFPGTRVRYVTRVNEDLGEGEVTFEISRGL
jgi:RNA polymerase sigma factor (sigma-70 family)